MKQAIALLMTGMAFTAIAGPLPDEAHVYVEGSAEIVAVPDQMELTVIFDTVESELVSAKQIVDDRTRTLLTALMELGVEPADIASRQVRVGPAYEYRDGQQKLIGIRVAREVAITLKDLSLYSDMLAALITAEVSNIGSAKFTVAGADELIGRASELALANARKRAERFASVAGRRLGAVYSISEFDLRQEETYRLRPDRRISADSDRSEMYLSAPDRMEQEPFIPGSIHAQARVYVVYLLGR